MKPILTNKLKSLLYLIVFLTLTIHAQDKDVDNDLINKKKIEENVAIGYLPSVQALAGAYRQGYGAYEQSYEKAYLYYQIAIQIADFYDDKKVAMYRRYKQMPESKLNSKIRDRLDEEAKQFFVALQDGSHFRSVNSEYANDLTYKNIQTYILAIKQYRDGTQFSRN